MAISNKSIKLLWSNAAGRCSFPDCKVRLSVEEAAEVAPYTIGEMAHIKGNKPGSNRYDEEQSADERDSYENLILLCPTHHTLIDKVENEDKYSVEILHEMKRAHENFISNRLSAIKLEHIEQLKDLISVYMAENYQAWEQYGPMSDNARKNPHNDQIYALWTSERLSTIVPNNREITKILQANRDLFTRTEQRLVSKFIQHVESYEQWVNDKIPYNSIQRFPSDFEAFVLGE
ncbi:HNH endonuclease [Escherichia coli]|uniref:HNH endonuclease signature motif containing protein n=1 Tax=Escherichia sp. WS2423 TaxID=3381964 RepID=UPI000944F860|nr:HNH endonuclease [Escherichia coli]EFH7847320.1 HNH endonuclease [Escherichia coli]EHI0300813.1 HNH endonuclease [Escherichia coli]EHZ3635673.1 HNH endonuclease [Escherichia coli]EIV9391354.1 HNH endonuclease [Escherichia coli]